MAFKTLAIRKLSMQEERIQKALYAAMMSNMLITEKTTFNPAKFRRDSSISESLWLKHT